MRNSIYRTGQRAATTAAAARGFASRAHARVALHLELYKCSLVVEFLEYYIL